MTRITGALDNFVIGACYTYEGFPSSIWVSWNNMSGRREDNTGARNQV
jgi:hypothetical protein